MPTCQEYNVDPDLQGFQRSYALETAIADQHGESMQVPGQADVMEAPTENYLKQQGSRPEHASLVRTVKLWSSWRMVACQAFNTAPDLPD